MRKSCDLRFPSYVEELRVRVDAVRKKLGANLFKDTKIDRLPDRFKGIPSLTDEDFWAKLKDFPLDRPAKP